MSVIDTSPVQESLAVRFHRGDESAITELYQTFARRIHATAMHLLGDRELAAEAVQRTFLRAWQSALHFDPLRDLQPWLYAIARRTAIDVYRSQRSWAPLPLEAADGVQRGDGVDAIESLWVTGEVRAALAKLPAGDQRLVRLAYFDGLRQSEIAAAEGLPIGTVKSRTARARQRLAGLLIHVN